MRWLVGISAMILTFLLAPVSPARAADGIPVPATSFKDKGTGAVTAADKDFVIRVRLAGLWEIAASNMAQEKSDDPRIVTIGKSIAAQHVVLDQLDRDVAKKLDIELPNVPNTDQRGWLAEMKAANSTTFDQIFVDRLRAAHGKIFPAIATIRSSTRNDSVVDYGALPTAPAPAVPTGNGPVPVDGQMLAAAHSNTGVPGVNTTVILLVLAAALVAGVITTMRIFRAR
jgi:predicted outer membrane protein